MRLEILHDDRVIHVHEFEGSVRIGRSSGNDVVLHSPSVSGHHALLFWEGGALFVRDLGSTNGTWIDARPVEGAVEVRPGERVDLGQDIGVRVVDAPDRPWRYALRRTDAPVGWPVDRSLFDIPGTDARLRVGEHEIWLLIDDEETLQVQVGVAFPVGDQELVLDLNGDHAETVRPRDSPFPYVLAVDLTGNRAVLSWGEHRLEVDSENRVALLHVLAERRRQEPHGGWVDDDALLVGVWGRAHARMGPNNLNVLIHRIRSAARAAGFDPAFLEKRSGATRVRVLVKEVVKEDPRA